MLKTFLVDHRFLDKNRNAPFDIKKTVVDACLKSSLLYGCEAWKMTEDEHRVDVFLHKCLRRILKIY